MSTAPVLYIVCCTESTSGTVLDPARYMNATNPHTTILKTDGARVTAGDQTISRIYYADQAKPLGMIVVLGHAGCTLASGDVEGTIRSSVQALRASHHVRNAIPTMGYVLDLYASAPGGPATGANMREVHIPDASAPASSASTQQQNSSPQQQQGIGPFWS
ncbi:hypothetical protein CC77DRAFT_1010056 [Alternaria alternata]|uniref:Carbonic anhydrase n=1 Tax=Alternaria alternata TaxID=5599 RepID=A0A177DI00_ALTAL|nr:hypothetical protein CC77DRAFT_1010056 [Alternaria alternata]OAG18810.1 hypothetical protein CC77DRAFT_1010056 [Alternaria alternata]